MALSNKFGWLVLTTGNKSEIAMGYSTLYGSSVFDRAPAAELRPDQTDQGTLPPYPELDAILQAYVEEDRWGERPGRARLRRGDRAPGGAHGGRQRVQAPPGPIGVKITPRAFGRDWRLPIVNRFREK